MILITGATGQLGTAVIDHLLARTDPTAVAALVRDPSKATELKARDTSRSASATTTTPSSRPWKASTASCSSRATPRSTACSSTRT